MKAIYIMWLRQLKRYFRSKSRIIGAIGQPLLFLFAFGFGFKETFAMAGQGDYLSFLVPGIIGMSVLFTSMFSGIEIIWDRKFGFLKETLVAPVSRFEIVLGKTLGGATVAIIQGLIILFLSYFIGFRISSIGSIFYAILFMILIAITFTAVGTAIASKMEDMHGFQLIMNFLIMPLFFLSGALFPLTNIPELMSDIININPLSYGVDGLRGALTSLYHFSFSLDLIILGLTASLVLAFGSYLFSKIQI